MNITENRELKDEESVEILKKILCTLLNFGRRNRGLARFLQERMFILHRLK